MNKFEFGNNWQKFLDKHFSNEALEASKFKLADFLGADSLVDKTFFDLGSGSGLHSLAALELGAEKVVSVDYDKNSVKCAEQFKINSPYKEKWQIKEGSLLDLNFLSNFGFFDIVYCWGVAHHTGNMWLALHNISKNVKVGGVIFVAIYNNVEGRLGSKMWWQVKNFY